MNPSQPTADYTQTIDDALATLASVQPRDGLEQRILASITATPALPWYSRFTFHHVTIAPFGQHRWMLVVASAIIVAGGVTMTTYRNHLTTTPHPAIVAHVPHPAQQPIASAASVGISAHPLQSNPARGRHRGTRRSYRAAHARVPLPRGTVHPSHPLTAPVMQ